MKNSTATYRQDKDEVVNTVVSRNDDMMEDIGGILDIYDNYDAFILDLWGVIHDGQKLYPKVYETISRLNEAGKYIVFLSNAPRRADKARQVLRRLGIDDSMYNDIVTSGEVLFEWLSGGCNSTEIGKSYFYIGPDKDLDILDGLDYTRCEQLERADWILNVGYQYEFQPLEELAGILQEAAQLGKYMICANPDIVVVRQNGERLGCAGEIAAEYERLGGKVKYFGKPYRDVYDFVVKRAGEYTGKIIAIGDSLHTDIVGANEYGIDTALVIGGILRGELLDSLLGKGDSCHIAYDRDRLKQLIENYKNSTPKYVMPTFGG